MNHEQQDSRVEFEHGALQQSTKGDVLENPAVVQPVRHNSVQDKGCGDGCALKVFALSSRILGQHGDGNVESRQTSQTAQDEEHKADGVKDRSQAQGECDHGRSDTE